MFNDTINVFKAGLLGLILGGSGIGIGAIIALIVGSVRRKIASFVIHVAAGMMMIIIVLDIIPESIAIGGFPLTIAGILLGLYGIRQFERISHRIITFTTGTRTDSWLRAGLLFTFAVALHNFPAGIALGSSLVNSPQLVKSLSITMITHAIPEGIALILPFVLANMSHMVLLIVAIVGIPTGLGACLGYVFGMIIPEGQSLLLGITVGTIVYIAIFEMVRPAWKERGGLSVTAGILIGGWLGLLLIECLH
ncbi:ZIP family zinc transporter [Paenibacillus taihuensis]|uniref:ZIP family zinc transporter n=1 Tax=Paenibacillus taihuensis TaxID=1156355 RepID=A0A3D9RU22_9BACL|nr:ZIP family metal transporter [Paenibacillus taihuensis]REE81034.1 ZIP family zinc transporter [Paenibacillus taihuensis]